MNTGKAGALPAISIAAGLIVGSLALPAAAANLVIDDFVTGQGPLTVSPMGTVAAPNSTWSSASGSGVIGGSRDIRISVGNGTNPFTSSVTVAGGIMDYANSPSVNSTVTFQWDGADNDPNAIDPAGLGGIDLEFGGNNAFEIGLVIDDLPAMLQMSVYSTNGDLSQVTFPTTGLIFTNLSIYIPFALFTGDADISNVGAIALMITSPTTAADIQFDFIRTAIAPVPVPGAIWFFGSALLGFVFTGRRRA